MSITDAVSPTIVRLLVLFVLSVVLVILAVFVVERSVDGALKALKLAIKFEFTTDVGRLNLVAMILFVVVIFVFNLHAILTDALSVDSTSRPADHVTVPALLIGLFFFGSLFFVMLLERKK
jgi:hypothetical protein